MSIERELLKKACEFLGDPHLGGEDGIDLYEKIETYLAKPEPEPVKYEFQDDNGKWCQFIDGLHYQMTVDTGHWPIRALYTAPPDQSGKIAELERKLCEARRFLSTRVEASRLDSAMDKITELNQQLAQKKPVLLSDDEIKEAIMHISFNQMTAFNIAQAIQTAVLKANGFDGGE